MDYLLNAYWYEESSPTFQAFILISSREIHISPYRFYWMDGRTERQIIGIKDEERRIYP